MNRVAMAIIAMIVYGIIVYFISVRKKDKPKNIILKKTINESLLFGVLYYIFNIILDKIWP